MAYFLDLLTIIREFVSLILQVLYIDPCPTRQSEIL